MTRLTARDLACARGGTVVLRGLDLDVGPGEVVVLRGRNGSGKTTLLRTLAGLQPPVAGTVAGAEDCAYAGHADGVKAALTVAENLSFWGRVFGTAPTLDLYRAFLLLPLMDRPAGTLSAGQARRLGLARLALAGRAVWLMDEPTVSLDAASVDRLAGIVARHCAGGGAAVIATHADLALGPEVAQRTLDVEGLSPHAAVADGPTPDPFSPWLFGDEL